MNISGIYKIQSKVNPNKLYIGSSENLTKRWKRHLSELRKNTHHSKILQNHFNKYGENDLIFIIIEPCLPPFLIIREQYYIDTLCPYFNVCKIAGNTKGVKLSEEAKRKMSIARMGHPGWNKGKKGLCKHTDEHKIRMSKLKKGVKRSEETKAKMRETIALRNAKLGIVKKSRRKTNEEVLESRKIHGQKITGEGNPMYGKTHSSEARKKMGDSRRGKKMSESQKQALLKANTGRHPSKETLQKYRDARLEYYRKKRAAELNDTNEGKIMPI